MRRYTFISFLIAASSMFSVMVVDMFGGGMLGWSRQGYTPRQSDSLYIETKIREQVAITTTTQVFDKVLPSDPSFASYGFRLPAGAMVTSFRWCVDGKWFTASLQASDTTLPADGGTASMDQFAQYFGESPFVFRFTDTFAVNTPLKTELTYVEVLSLKAGHIEYSYPYRALGLATSIPLTSWTIDAMAERPIEIPSVVGITPAESTIEERHVRYQMSSQFLQQPVVGFRYRLKYDGLTMSVLSTKPVGEDGYALMMAVPESDASIEEVLPKRFTFVIDHSGSMSGEKMVQARQAAEYCVRRLNPDDVLSVIQFSSSTWIWGDPHKPATPTNIESAAAYIRGIYPDGGTDIMLALKVALQRHTNDQYVNVIIFLTDGQAPIDHATLASYNTSATRIFVFGIGSGVNETDLRKIAEDHKGSYHFVTDPAMTVANVSELFDRINDPLIKNPAVRFSPDVVYDVYPTVVPDVYKGEELLLVGRYTTPGDVTVSVSGSNREGAVQHQFAAHLTDDPNIHTFVGKIWAKYRIAMLLDMMKKEATGSSNWKEWRDEIIRLGRQFSIVTPFTSFVDGGQTDPGDDADDDTDDGTDDNSSTTTVEHDEIIVARERCTISPNPVATTTHISIDLTDMDRSNVRVEIVDLAGRTIAVLYDESTAPERLELDWNVMDQSGVSVPAGAYLVCVTIGGVRSTATISVVR